MAAAGASPAEIERELAGRRVDVNLEVWPENWATWRVWLELGTAWTLVAGFGGIAYVGIAAAAIESTLNLMGIRGQKKRQRIFAGVRTMERAALPVLNESDE